MSFLSFSSASTDIDARRCFGMAGSVAVGSRDDQTANVPSVAAEISSPAMSLLFIAAPISTSDCGLSPNRHGVTSAGKPQVEIIRDRRRTNRGIHRADRILELKHRRPRRYPRTARPPAKRRGSPSNAAHRLQPRARMDLRLRQHRRLRAEALDDAAHERPDAAPRSPAPAPRPRGRRPRSARARA